MTIEELLITAKENKASDVHITVGLPPKMRINGILVDMDYPRLLPPDTEAVISTMMSDKRLQQFEELGEIDFSYSIPQIGRYRVNVFHQRGSMAASIRLVSTKIPLPEELGIPKSVVDLYQKKRGLVLVTGPTGSGKSTTLASIIDRINSMREVHVITLEDPIEYLHNHKKAMASDLEKRYASADEMLADLEEFRKNPEVDLDFTIADLHRETVDEPTQYIPAVHTVSKAQKVQEADEEEEEASPHKLGTRKLLTIIGAAVAAVALIVLLWHAIFSDLLGGEQTPTEYVVPYLIGMTIDEANEDENVKGIFTIEQIGQRASSKYAAGQIIEQSPERGKTVKGNRVISVFVSSGAKTEKMPNLVNKEYRDATLQLTNLDLNLVVNDPVEEYSNITKGYVIRTIPEYGETLQEGDSVTLVVSKGEQPKPVTVLSFIGIDIKIVRQQVTQTGLVVGEVTQRASDEPYGTVIEQSINAETKVDAGTTINFVISEGPAMPDYGDDATTSGGEPQP